MESLRKSQLVVTRGVHEKIEQDSEFAKGVYTSLRRYYSGDWGDLCDEDKEMNEMALKCGDRIFAMYKLGNDKIYNTLRLICLGVFFFIQIEKK